MKAFKKLTQLRKIGIPLSRHVSFFSVLFGADSLRFHVMACVFACICDTGDQSGADERAAIPQEQQAWRT
jgi:hypothetical protein